MDTILNNTTSLTSLNSLSKNAALYSIDGGGTQVENYIYMYHLQQYIVLPSFADSITDTMQVEFVQSTPLGRSAPIYSYKNSGPRSVQVSLDLHRDLMTELNKNISDAKVALGDDYVDTLIKDLQAIVLPSYDGSTKAINPPIIALRMGEDIFIKGVISGSLNITYYYPILDNGKYSHIGIGFNIVEIDPYDASLVRKTGSYRNVSTDLDYTSIYSDLIPSTVSVSSNGERYHARETRVIEGEAIINTATSVHTQKKADGIYEEYLNQMGMSLNDHSLYNYAKGQDLTLLSARPTGTHAGSGGKF